MSEEEIEVTKKLSSAKKRKHEIKESQKKRKTDLRRKNLGLGIGSIDVNAPTKSTKIKFDDDVDDVFREDGGIELDIKPNQEEAAAGVDKGNRSDSHDDDDDDEVEQVSASAAKNEALQILAAERKTRKIENVLTQKRKRKKKTVQDIISSKTNQNNAENNDEDDDEDLDEEFLSMVDTARENDSKMKKLKKESSGQLKKMGRHTTFVSEESESNATMKPINADHNIDVVVLPLVNAIEGDDDGQLSTVLKQKAELSLSSDLSTKPSNAALLLCRGTHNIENSSVGGSVKQSVVKRSKKMKYKLSLKRPAADFAVRRRKRD